MPRRRREQDNGQAGDDNVVQLESEDRDTLLDAIREGFKALGVGGSIDWVEAAEREDEGTYDA